jgi:hypothetical protein
MSESSILGGNSILDGSSEIQDGGKDNMSQYMMMGASLCCCLFIICCCCSSLMPKS